MTSGKSAAAARPAAIAAAFALCLAASCAVPHEAYLVGDRGERKELSELFALVDEAGGDGIQRFAAIRQISTRLLAKREYGKLTALLTSLAGSASDAPAADPYSAWYLFTTAYAFEKQGSSPIAALYYDRIVKNWPDVVVDGRSVHFECLSRLIETSDSPERRIEYYKDLLARFPRDIDAGRILFLLGKEYEEVGDWELAVKTYSRFLPYFGSEIPGHPDAFQYARNVIDFYNSPKDWTYEDLQTLVRAVKTALASNDPYRLKRLRAKVNFFAVSWHQDEIDVNSQALFDFSQFMTGGRIFSAESLDPGSGTREAYLKTWGWSERISTWYFFFRKIYFPADPEIHGRWEWAGVYFGERMR